MTGHFEASDPIDAWVQVLRFLDSTPGRHAYHLVARIESAHIDPVKIDAVDALLVASGKQRVETVANTIFPRSMAASSADEVALAARYRDLYPTLRRLPGNTKGTYFGRLVDYPEGGKRADQLSHTIKKMRRERDGGHKTSIFECAIYNPRHDAGKLQSFPCLSWVAFHLDHDNGLVHLAANYRNHSVFERTLGNYVGLARLRDYVANQVEFAPGQLTVTSGHAKIEAKVLDLRHLINSAPF